MLIEIFQDTVCPWCRIGKANLFKALGQWQGEDVQIRWRTFLLDDTLPAEGVPFREHMADKFGGRVDLDQMFGSVTNAGAAAGVHFDFSKVTRMPNTRLSNQLIVIASDALKEPVIERVNKAYFEEGLDTAKLDVLLDVAEKAGMDREDTRRQLEAGAGIQQIEQDIAFARQAGITGVPFVVLNGKFAVSGAQPPEQFVRALEHAAANS
ncbi:DsbA family oxidoreductase [Paenibacillus thalictri]|uniref:DsbA family oxidoreductase n=1 Tax=Paenibacillus thalictri TaxID=2527873 RepID=A0A4Q9DI53_9BACL|nr:DsbA family oxidoreductase [Paenibacillus thalictri]TBL72693.1 DsbA family oxidoreductase [Paenibacillus thalictri]